MLRRLLILRAEPYESWASSALVFAPHEDDETLGCGGTIAKKRRHGAVMHVAFMTDGSRSHEGRMPREELAALRHAEAGAACEVLGVGSSDVTFLGIEDGTLDAHADAAREAVVDLLKRHQPEEVFVPSHDDDQREHVATRRIVCDALSSGRRPVRVLEYPVWLWHHWPWVRLSGGGRRMATVLHAAARSERALYRDLRCVADVRDTLDTKRAALRCHRTQMERFRVDAPWPVLSDVSAGEWLECFFTGHELFHRYTWPRAGDA